MGVLRQAASADAGRVNQKRRTRAAIVAAARDLLSGGVTPTVAQAAEAAFVSRTTAYRYFPTQESLLLEVAVHVDVGDVEALVARPLDGEDPAARVLDVIGGLGRHVLADEARYRTALRLYLDQWLTASAQGDDTPVVREGRRRRWIETSLAPLRASLGDAGFERLVAALAVVSGAEALIVLRDVCQLGGDDALDVVAWAARSLIDAALADLADAP